MTTREGPALLWRVALLVMVVAGILWLGGAAARALIGNDLLVTGTLQFDEMLAPEAEREVHRLLAVVTVLVMLSYGVTLAASIVFLTLSPLRLREHGWLMMAAILFYVWTPVEAYLTYLDARLVYLEFFTTADNAMLRDLFTKRVTALAGAPFIATLCYFTIVALAVFQPLRKRP